MCIYIYITYNMPDNFYLDNKYIYKAINAFRFLQSKHLQS